MYTWYQYKNYFFFIVVDFLHFTQNKEFIDFTLVCSIFVKKHFLDILLAL